ncbi:hypothetical protein [Caldithrix abyssi]
MIIAKPFQRFTPMNNGTPFFINRLFPSSRNAYTPDIAGKNYPPANVPHSQTFIQGVWELWGEGYTGKYRTPSARKIPFHLQNKTVFHKKTTCP